MPTFRLQLSHDADELVEFEVGGRPSSVGRYSVVLRYLDSAGNATAVRVYDNSHELEEHHMHPCDPEGRPEQPPELFHQGDPHAALMEARTLVENGFEGMIAGWQR